MEPPGPVQACNGIALPFCLLYNKRIALRPATSVRNLITHGSKYLVKYKVRHIIICLV